MHNGVDGLLIGVLIFAVWRMRKPEKIVDDVLISSFIFHRIYIVGVTAFYLQQWSGESRRQGSYSVLPEPFLCDLQFDLLLCDADLFGWNLRSSCRAQKCSSQWVSFGCSIETETLRIVTQHVTELACDHQSVRYGTPCYILIRRKLRDAFRITLSPHEAGYAVFDDTRLPCPRLYASPLCRG